MPRTIRVVGDERFWVGCFTDQNFHIQYVAPRLELATANSDLRLGIRAAVPFGTAPVGVKVHGVEDLSRRGRNSARERQRTEPEQCLRGTQRTVGEWGVVYALGQQSWWLPAQANANASYHSKARGVDRCSKVCSPPPPPPADSCRPAWQSCFPLTLEPLPANCFLTDGCAD